MALASLVPFGHLLPLQAQPGEESIDLGFEFPLPQCGALLDVQIADPCLEGVRTI